MSLRWPNPSVSRRNGSSLLLVLFVCLGSSLLALSLAAILVTGERALQDEKQGRARWARAEIALGEVARAAAHDWAVGPLSLPVDPSAPTIYGELADPQKGDGWWLEGTAGMDTVAGDLSLAARVERGRDGLDLPDAAMVAGRLIAAEGRQLPWVEGGMGSRYGAVAAVSAEVALLVQPSAPLWGENCSARSLTTPWRLDPGTAARVQEGDEAAAVGTVVLRASRGECLTVLTADAGRTPDAPVLVVATGGPILDLTSRGDLYGVIVADEGSVRLEGTHLHGALFAGGWVDLGLAGQLTYDRSVWRWATDRSLVRTRLVPGTRRENIGP